VPHGALQSALADRRVRSLMASVGARGAKVGNGPADTRVAGQARRFRELLGHNSAEMTMRYIEVALSDLQRECLLARLQPRHLSLGKLARNCGREDPTGSSRHVNRVIRRE